MYSHFSTQAFFRTSSSNKQGPADSSPEDLAVIDAGAEVIAGTMSFRCFFIHPSTTRVNSTVYVSSAVEVLGAD